MLLRIKLMVLGVFGSLAFLYVAYVKGRSSQRTKEEVKTLTDYINTRERIDEANSITRSADSAREWLRNRNK